MHSHFSPNLAGVSDCVPLVLKKGITSNFNIGDLGFSAQAPWAIFNNKRLGNFFCVNTSSQRQCRKDFNSCHMVEMQLKGSPFKKLLQSRFNYFLTPPLALPCYIVLIVLWAGNLDRCCLVLTPNPNSNCYMHKSILLL